MKSSRWLVFGLLGLVLAFGLSGCIIVLASPNPKQIIEMKPGDKVIFKVAGPVNTSIAGYVWTINKSETNEVVSEGKNEFEYMVNPEGEMTNRVEITCATYGYAYVSSEGGWAWDWCMNDYRTWSIRILGNTAPIWQGDYYIKDSTDLQLLKGYTTVTGSLIIGPSIESLEGLESLTSVGGYLRIVDNAALTSLSGLENLTSVGGDLGIAWNNALTSLTGLDNLTSVGGYLQIEGNDVLTSLAGLENITAVSGGLYIGDNDALTSLEMTGLQRVDGDFRIYYNLLLCTSLAEELMNQVLAGGGIGGGRDISGNKDCTTP